MLRLKSGWTTKLKEFNPGGGPGVGQEAGGVGTYGGPQGQYRNISPSTKILLLFIYLFIYSFIYLFTYL